MAPVDDEVLVEGRLIRGGPHVVIGVRARTARQAGFGSIVLGAMGLLVGWLALFGLIGGIYALAVGRRAERDAAEAGLEKEKADARSGVVMGAVGLLVSAVILLWRILEAASILRDNWP